MSSHETELQAGVMHSVLMENWVQGSCFFGLDDRGCLSKTKVQPTALN